MVVLLLLCVVSLSHGSLLLLLLLQVTIPNGKASAYWKCKGWKYNNTRWTCFLELCVLAQLSRSCFGVCVVLCSPPWTAQPCDQSVWTYINKVINNLDGFSGVEWVEYGKVGPGPSEL